MAKYRRHKKGRAKGRVYRVAGLSDKPRPHWFAEKDEPNAIGGIRPLLAGDTPVSEGKTTIAKGKSPILRRRRLLKGADE